MQLQVEVLRLALRPDWARGAEAHARLGMESLRVRDGQLRPAERSQERRHGLEMAERDGAPLFRVPESKRRATFRGLRDRRAALQLVVLGVVNDGVHHLVIARAARGAALVAVGAIVRRALFKARHLLLPQVRLGHFVIDVIEGQHFVLALLAVSEEGQSDAVLRLGARERLLPRLEVEVLGPAVEALPGAVRVQHRRRETPVAERQCSFQRSLTRIVRLDVQIPIAAAELAQLVAQQAVLPIRFGKRDHRVPLEWRERLGAEGRHAHVDLGARLELLAAPKRFRAELHDGAHVLVTLRRQPDHEVELHQLPARLEDRVDGVEQVLLGVALVDHAPHPLGSGLRGDGEAALAHARDLLGEARVHRLRAQARQRDADVLRSELVEEVLEHAVDAGVVARGKAEEPDFLVASRLQPHFGDAADLVGIALPRRPRDHPDLAEAAPARAAPLDLQRQSVVHSLHERYDRLLRLRHEVQVGNDAPDDRLVPRLERLDRLDRPVGSVAWPEERRDVHARDLGEVPQEVLAAGARTLPFGDDVADLVDRFFALSYDERIEEVGDRLRVVRARPATQHERVVAAALAREERHASQFEHREHRRVAKLELKRESEHVERRCRRAALDREERQPLRAQRRFHVGPRHEEALARDVGPLVQRVVQQSETDIAHPDFVRVGECEAPLQRHAVEALVDGIQLAARVARRLLRAEDEAFEDGQLHGGFV